MANVRAQALLLRHREHDATPEVLAQAAFDLVVERGLDGLTGADIAAAAMLPVRSFSKYFPSVEAAIAAATAKRAADLAQAQLVRPREEPLADAIVAVYGRKFAILTSVSQDWLNGFIAMLRSPALRGEYQKASLNSEAHLAGAIAERTGLDAMRDLLPKVLAASITGVERVAVRHWIELGGEGDLSDIFASAVRLVLVGADGVKEKDPGH